MDKRSLQSLSDSELVKEAQRLMREKDSLRQDQLKVREELDTRAIREQAERLADSLGNPELVAKVLPGVAGARGGE